MFCPSCKAEFRVGVERCADCGELLVDALPQVGEPPALLQIPVFLDGEIVAIQSLLSAKGFFFAVNEGFGEVPDAILIRESDLEEIQGFLSDFRVTLRTGEIVPIPW